MKPFLNLLLLSFFTLNLWAQNTSDVTLTVVGSGKTIEEAKTNALRSAIEQAYGAFVSSNTEILNDEIVKDEIVSISSGNIKEFKILSQSELTGDLVSMTMSATVSVSSLQSYAQSKGATVEFAGGLFAMNLKMQELNEQNEVTAIRQLCYTIKVMTDNAFDYSIKTNDPKLRDEVEQKWELEVDVTVSANKTFVALKNYLIESLNGISMTDDEATKYKELNKKVFQFEIKESDSLYHYYKLRHLHSLAFLQDFVWYLDYGRGDFLIDFGALEAISLFDSKSEWPDDGYNVTYVNVFNNKYVFKPFWRIYLNAVSYDDLTFYPPYGGFESHFRLRATYELTKRNIQKKFEHNLISNERGLKSEEKYVNNGMNRDRQIREYQNNITHLKNCMADSTTSFVYQGEGNVFFKSTTWKNMKISLTPIENEKIGVFTVYVNLTREQLEKISSITVK
jgi:hypothetical protein